MKKRITALWLVIMLAAVYMPLHVSAANITYSGDCGDNLTWSLDGRGVLTISGTGDMTDFKSHVWGEHTPSFSSTWMLRV